MTWLWLLVLILGCAWLAHRRSAPAPALGMIAVYLIFMGLFSHAHGWMLVLWLPWLALSAVLLLPELRRRLPFSRKLPRWGSRSCTSMA